MMTLNPKPDLLHMYQHMTGKSTVKYNVMVYNLFVVKKNLYSRLMVIDSTSLVEKPTFTL